MAEKEILIEKLQSTFKHGGAFSPYISSIVFPNYKNIYPGSELTFDFPLTLLIGKNGTNKSSILHALYGCPDGQSPADYWFATHVDPIEGRPAFFYRYKIPGTNFIAEVLKTYIKKKHSKSSGYDPDYWEPSRPITSFGMKKMPPINEGQTMQKGRSKTRWNAIEKDVIYLDFRTEISAFDRAFYSRAYYNSQQNMSRPAHRALLRKRSRKLKAAIDAKKSSDIHYLKERITQNFTFPDSYINKVNDILETEYTSIEYVEHDYYMQGGYSVYLRKEQSDDQSHMYSEAFAGSGETSVVRLVYALENATNSALVLLDEPETSLHIGAQENFQRYLLKKIWEKKLQVVMSTHSPFFVDSLPNDAIKVLNVDPNLKNKVTIMNSAPAHASSFHLGHKSSTADKMKLYVEDAMAQAIVLYACYHGLEASYRDRLSVIFLPGGSTSLLNLAGYESLSSVSQSSFMLDGDVKKSRELPREENIPKSQDSKLEKKVKDALGHCPTLPGDSNNPQQKIDNLRSFIRYANSRIKFLPFANPEKFVAEHNRELIGYTPSLDAKQCIADYATKQIGHSGEVTSKDLLTIQRQLINNIPKECEEFKQITTSVMELIDDCQSAWNL